MMDILTTEISIPIQGWHILVLMIIMLVIVVVKIVIILKKPKKIKDKLDIGIDIPNLIVSVCLLLVTANLYNYQNDTLKSENTPYPYISSVSGRIATPEELQNINIRNPLNSNNEPVITWYYYGKQEATYLGKDIEDIGIELIETNPEDRKIINEIKNNEGSVCFSKINDHNCILFINEGIKSSFILEYCSADIEVKNYGASFHNFQLESIKVFFNDEKGKEEIILNSENTNQKTIPLIIEPDNSVSLIYCQVTNNLIYSQCITSEDIIYEIGSSYDLLKKGCQIML